MQLGWLEPERLPELQRLIDEHWRRGHVLARDEELLRWQHPVRGDGRLSVVVADEEGSLVGMLGFVPFRACVRELTGRGGWMTNWLVVPEARGRKLGHELVQRVLEADFDLIGALGANSATRAVLGRAGFVEAGMCRWVRVFDVDALARLLDGREIPDEAWAAWREAADGPVADRPGSIVGACRDAELVAWRYEHHPRFDYTVLRDGDRLAAYRVERVQGSDASVVRIADFLGDPEFAERVADAVAHEAAVFADFSCTSPAFGAPLEAHGFQREDRLPAQLPGRFQPLDFSDRPLVSCFWAADRLGGNAVFAGDDLYVTRADSDLDRPS
jgi:RimJ/RimL family protein N-acetyltransferase